MPEIVLKIGIHDLRVNEIDLIKLFKFRRTLIALPIRDVRQAAVRDL
jgi:hypothetical protein